MSDSSRAESSQVGQVQGLYCTVLHPPYDVHQCHFLISAYILNDEDGMKLKLKRKRKRKRGSLDNVGQPSDPFGGG